MQPFFKICDFFKHQYLDKNLRICGKKQINYNVFVNNLMKLLSKRKGMFLSNF